MQLIWCVATVVLGLLLAVVMDASPGAVALGWTVVVLGAVGVVLSLAMPIRRR